MVSVLESMIQEFKTNTEAGLIGRSRIVDHLLDLRLAATDSPAVVAEIDRFLSSVPGKSSVESSWWCSALEGLEDLAAPAPVG